MNKPLLNKVKKFIRENPERLDMGLVDSSGPCGCIAHHAVTMDGGKFPDDCDWSEVAATKLGLTPFQAEALFIVSFWPIAFRYEYGQADLDSKQPATIAIRRINHFMKTGK